MKTLPIRLSSRTVVELSYDDPHRNYDVSGFGTFIRSLKCRRTGKGYSYTGVIAENEIDILHKLLSDMDCRIQLQGGREGIDYPGSSSVCGAVRKDFDRLLKAAKELDFDVSEWEQ